MTTDAAKNQAEMPAVPTSLTTDLPLQRGLVSGESRHPYSLLNHSFTRNSQNMSIIYQGVLLSWRGNGDTIHIKKSK